MTFDELALAEDRCERAAMALQALQGHTVTLMRELRRGVRELEAALDALAVARGIRPPARAGDSDTTAALDLAARGWAALRTGQTMSQLGRRRVADVITADGRRQCEVVEEDRAGRLRGDSA